MVSVDLGRISRADALVRRFGVGQEALRANARWHELAACVASDVAKECTEGRVVLVSGSSGSGKSLLLRSLAMLLGGRSVNAQKSEFAGRLVVDCLPWLELEQALEVLARFGLGEVYTYLSPAELLSTGQQSRLRLAMAYARAMGGGGKVLIADEFGTQLDQISAAVIARNLRRVVSESARFAAVVASCHSELEKPLRPDVVVDCDFGEYRMRGRDAGTAGR